MLEAPKPYRRSTLVARFRRHTALALVMAAVASAPAWAIDDFFPTFGNLGIDVQDYGIRLDIAGKGERIEGKASLEITATRRLTAFSLDLADLTVSRVEIDGVVAQFWQANDKLTISPPAAIAKGRTFTATITYAGAPETVPDPTAEDPAAIPGLGWTKWTGGSYVVSEPVGAGTWYPVNDQPTDKASYRFTLLVDKPYTAVANGVPVSVTDLGQRRRFVWEQRQPMASFLAITDVDEYRLVRQTSRSGVPIRNYVTADTPPENVASLRKQAAMMSFIEDLIGPYPFDGYGSVMVDDPDLFYALETQAMSTFQSSSFDDLTVIHELAHQWFGNAVTVAQWRDLWLAEGFATYFEFLWEFRGNQAGFDEAMAGLHAFVVQEGVGPAVVSRPQDLFALNTYYRGALTLEALRLTVGDRKFRQILRGWYRTYRNKNATSQDFIDLAAGLGGREVRPLLKAWLYEQPVPPLPGAATAVAARASGTPVPPPQLGIGVRRPHAP